jgi:hypothetical protein
MTTPNTRLILAIAVLLLVFVMHAGSRAQVTEEHRGPGPTPPRVSLVDGEVSFWRPGAEDWAPAKVNTPLAPGDSVYAGDRGNIEVQVAPRVVARAGSDTQLGLETLEDDFVQFKVTAGHAAVDVRESHPGRTIEVDTPQGAFTIDQPGYYRLDVDQDRATFITRRGGKGSVVPAGGQETDVAPDTQVVLQGNAEGAQLSTGGAPAPDDWDNWNTARTDSLGEPRSTRYLPRDVSGAEDLDRSGAWHNEPQYGPVWVPAATPPGWAPYSAGRWIWDPYYGWTWVDDAPWGWAPFHYGRWVSVGGVWGWAPGPIIATPFYAPALVGFFGAPGVGVSVSIGFPFVSWVALGFGEPLVPWWGPVGFIGTCWWGGWGGPHVVNNVVVQRNTYVNVRNVRIYRNEQVTNAVIAVHRDRFGHPGGEHVRLSPTDVHRLQPVHGNLAVHPTPPSLVPSAGRGIRPPEAVRTRPVAATRAPEDPRPHLRASGLNPEPAQAPPPRLVQSRHGAPTGAPRTAASGAQPQPPPPPHAGHQPVSNAPQHPTPPAAHPSPGATSRVPTEPRREAPSPPRAGQPREGAAPPAARRTGSASETPTPSSRPAPAPGYPRQRPTAEYSRGTPHGGAPRPAPAPGRKTSRRGAG